MNQLKLKRDSHNWFSNLKTSFKGNFVPVESYRRAPNTKIKSTILYPKLVSMYTGHSNKTETVYKYHNYTVIEL